MAAVDPPIVRYSPVLPRAVIDAGLLSVAQLEAIIYAGAAHSELLPNGSRRGFFLGDGTGVGKGREISGIILDNMLQGRTKALWISFNEGLLNDAQRDFCSIGGDPAKIFFQGKTKPGNEISQDSGILFTTYSTLRSGEKRQASDTGQDAGKTRLEQIVDWLGRDFDGVIAFDEAHSMGNAVAIKGKRGLRKPSQQALAGINLQRELPNARVVYVSATGATEISNLSYADRLGLWGEGTPFADLHAFIGQISEGGIAAMELISRDMKAMGMYIARSLSFDGVTYERLEHPLSELQEDIYNELAGAWQIVLNNVNEALKITQAGKNGAAKSAAMAQFWGAHQRFFNQILTSMQTPAVIDHMRQHIDAGHAVVIQLVNTNEATQERIVAAATANDIPLEDLDFTPRQMLIDYVRNGFPVAAFEESADDNGNRIYVPVRDREGNQVFDRQAIAMRDGLLATLHEIRVPENPIDLIINAFGADRVAEVTGRTRRYTQSRDDEGNLRVVEEKRGRNASRLDADAFQNDAKKILIFSAAGGTGYSFHADNTAANTRKRVHYLLQPGWRADAAVQGFGRTHRSNQSCAPQYVLPTTNLKAQKRFVSSIARRLDQLGALTRGQRQATTQGMFTASDNLESEYAKIGLRNFFVDLYRGETALSFQDVTQQMGLILIDQNGAFSESSIPNIPQFLNRLLSLRTGLQNQVFDEFEHRLVEAVEYAKQRGTYDEGLQTLKALSIRKTRDDIAYEDPKTGAQTRYVELAVTNTLHYHPWEDITAIAQRADGPLSCWFVSERGVNKGQVFFLAGRGERLDAEGNTVQRGVIYGIRKNSHRYIDNADVIHRGWDYREIGGSLQQVTISRQVTQAQAERLWKAQLRAAPKTETTSACMLVGVILPIWDRVAGAETIYRLQTDDGEQLLGRFLEPTAAKQTLHNLGLHSKTAELSADETFGAIKSGKRAVLSNGWEVSLSIVNHEPRIEIKANTLTDAEKRLLTAQGAFVERISWTERVFIPAGSNGPAIFARITASKPVVDIFQRRREGSAGPSVTNTPESDAQEARLPELNGDDDRQRSRSNLTANLGASMAKKKHHELVAEKLIEQLKQGTAPWQRPWDPCDRLLPVNPITGKRYRGANLIALMCEERTDCRWMTFRQAAAKGWQVRSGERGTTIQFWKFSDEQTNTDENGKPVKVTVQLERPRVFYATVFNAEQIDGIPPLDLLKPPQWNAHERAEQILNAAGAVIKYVPGAGPFYRASTDTIQLPYRGQFPTADGFYAIALHETAHASGHPTRLNRELLGHPFGSEGYAKEELRAEIASMIIGDELGIGHDPRQHAAYVGSWIKILKDDPLEIFRAAAEAERIQEYVLGLEQRREQEQALEETLDELHRDAQQLEVPMQTAKQINDYEQAVTAARLREAQVKANPDSTREEISAAREDRKLAELIATLNDEELQRLKANYERDVQTERDNASAEATRTARERQYLAVPYAERNAAKAAGALWDRAAKSWYAGPKAAMQKIQRWLPGNIAPRQKPALSPRDEFAEALRSVGCLVSGDHPIMDGQKHRITVQGEKYSENSGSGFYVGHLDGHPAGYIKNNRTGVELRWKSKGYALSDAQQAQLRADSANKLRARADEQNRLHEAAAQRVAQQIATLIPIAEPTPYLNAKGIAAQPGVFTDARKQTTFVPATDADGKLWTVQYIQPDGTKRFAKGSRKEGCLHVVGGFDALAKAPVLVISEGYATAATLSQALGFATVAAFDSGNLVPVAKALHEKFPEKKIVVAGDDDKHLELTQGVNPGRCKAEEAAKAAGGTVLFPVFAPGETSYPTGLDPVTPEKFRKGVLSEEQQAALTKMKQHTDFNDLATRSALGPEAVKRQIRPAVELLKQQSSVVATQVKRARTQRNGALRAPGL